MVILVTKKCLFKSKNIYFEKCDFSKPDQTISLPSEFFSPYVLAIKILSSSCVARRVYTHSRMNRNLRITRSLIRSSKNLSRKIACSRETIFNSIYKNKQIYSLCAVLRIYMQDLAKKLSLQYVERLLFLLYILVA